MADEFRRHDRHPEDLTRQFKDLGTTDPQGRPVYAEVVALEPASIGGGGGGVASAVAIADGVSSAIKATVTGALALKVDGSAVTQPISAASLPLPTGAATEATLSAVNTKLAGTIAVSGTFWQATQPVSGTFWQATQPISAATLPLPTGASTEATLAALSAKLPAALTGSGNLKVALVESTAAQAVTGTFWQATQPVSGTFWQATQPVSGTFWPTAAGSPASHRLSDGTAFYDAAKTGQLPAALVSGRLDVNLGASITVPVSGTFWQATQPVSGTFWQATQPISAASLPLPTGAATEATSAAISGKLPAALVGGRLDTNIGAVGNVAVTAKALPTGADGQPAIPVWVNSMQYLTYDVGARGIVSGALVAGTPKAIMSFEHAATSTKTVRIRRIVVHFIQTTGLSGAIDIQITRGTAASSAGTAVTPQPRKLGDAAAEVTVKTLPTITAATIADNIPVGGFSATTVLYSGPIVVYDWQEAGETKPYLLTAGALQSIVINVVSTAAHNLTMTVSVDLTEES